MIPPAKSLKEEFDEIIKGVFPDGRGGCALTFKRRKEYERVFFAGAAVMQARYMHSGFQSQEQAIESFQKLETEIRDYMGIPDQN